MRTDTAIELISRLVYKPGWSFKVSDHTKRFQSAIAVEVTYPAQNSDQEHAPEYRQEIPGGARATFTIMCSKLEHPNDLYAELIRVIMVIEEHEAREFLRVAPYWVAPFHPHRDLGIGQWAQVNGLDLQATYRSDMTFGLA